MCVWWCVVNYSTSANECLCPISISDRVPCKEKRGHHLHLRTFCLSTFPFPCYIELVLTHSFLISFPFLLLIDSIIIIWIFTCFLTFYVRFNEPTIQWMNGWSRLPSTHTFSQIDHDGRRIELEEDPFACVGLAQSLYVCAYLARIWRWLMKWDVWKWGHFNNMESILLFLSKW